MTEKKYYVTELTIRVLSVDDPWDGNFQSLSYDVTKGEFVGELTNAVTVELSADEMAEALIDAGSDPGFFDIEEPEAMMQTKKTIVVTAEGQEWA